MAITVPRQRADPVARLHVEFAERPGDFFRALAGIQIGIAVDTALHRA